MRQFPKIVNESLKWVCEYYLEPLKEMHTHKINLKKKNESKDIGKVNTSANYYF